MKVKLSNLLKKVGLGLNKAWLWVKKYWKFVVPGLLFIIILCYIIYLKSKKDASVAEVAAMELQLDVYKKALELSSLETERALILLKQSYTKREIEIIDKKIEDVNKDIENIHKKIEDMNLEEKIRRYNELNK